MVRATVTSCARAERLTPKTYQIGVATQASLVFGPGLSPLPGAGARVQRACFRCGRSLSVQMTRKQGERA